MIRHSSRQLIVAKCMILAMVAFIAGPQVADQPSELAISIIVVFAMAAACLAVYEALARGLDLLLGRFWRPSAAFQPVPITADELSIAPASPARAALRARHVAAALAAYLAAGALVWFVAAVVATMQLDVGAREEAVTQVLKTLVPIALPVSGAAGCIALLLTLRGWRKRMSTRALAETIGLGRGTDHQLFIGLIAGAALSVIFLILMPYVPYRPSSPSLITEIALGSGLSWWAWIISAVALAPPIEEFMFRGVLLGGLTGTWGLRAGALVSATMFWLMHAPEWLEYWPAAVAIALMTAVVTWLRLRTRSLGPSIAAHFAYNLVLVGAMSSISPHTAPADRPHEPQWSQVGPGALSYQGRMERALGTLLLREGHYGR